MGRVFLGIVWALGTALLFGIASALFMEALKPSSPFGGASSFNALAGGFFGMLAWIVYRLGDHRFLSRRPDPPKLPAARSAERIEPRLRG